MTLLQGSSNEKIYESIAQKIVDSTSSSMSEALVKIRLKQLIKSSEYIELVNSKSFVEEHSKDLDVITEGTVMNKYIGFIRLDNYYYYNFYPKYILCADKSIKPIDEPTELFPERGNIYLDDGYSKENIKQFCDSNKFCVIEFSDLLLSLLICSKLTIAFSRCFMNDMIESCHYKHSVRLCRNMNQHHTSSHKSRFSIPSHDQPNTGTVHKINSL